MGGGLIHLSQSRMDAAKPQGYKVRRCRDSLDEISQKAPTLQMSSLNKGGIGAYSKALFSMKIIALMSLSPSDVELAGKSVETGK